MGCDTFRGSVIQMLVICLWLQHIQVSLSVPSAITFKKHSESDVEEVSHKLRITRAAEQQAIKQRRKYADYSDDVVSHQDQFLAQSPPIYRNLQK